MTTKTKKDHELRNVIGGLVITALILTIVICVFINVYQNMEEKVALFEEIRVTLVAEELNIEPKEVMLIQDWGASYDVYATTKGDYRVKFTEKGNLPKLKSIVPSINELD
jgi:hypothetical protein